MASLPERAHTCKLPPRNHASFRPVVPDWAKIDIVGQTILLAELTPHFGSFQNTCRALKLQSNEVKSFFMTYLQYQQDSKEGNLIAEQWGRDQAVLPAEGQDIPQQRPLLVTPAMIAPACDFLHAIGYHDCIEAVQKWVRRVILWPPNIDISGTDLSRLDEADIIFPQPRGERQLCRYKSFLGNDNRAVVGIYGAWKPKENGTPVARLSYIDVPQGSVAYGPGGSRNLALAGRYYVCWPTKSLYQNEYNDLVLATNIAGTRDIESTQFELPHHDDFNPDDVGSQFMDFAFDDIEKGEPGDPPVEQRPLAERIASIVNPKDIFGSDLGTAHFLGQQNIRPPFLPQTAPQGPFRLPRNYTITGPQGHIVTFDPPDRERYDESGAPFGLGGTYHIVPPPRSNIPTQFKIEELPAHVALRVKTTQRLVIVRNGYVMPYFVEAGVHEWSTREGILDLYGPHGCYNVFAGEAPSNIFSGAVESSPVQRAHYNNAFNDMLGDGLETEYAGYTMSAATSLAPIGGELKGDMLYHEDEEMRQFPQDVEGNEQHMMHIAPLAHFSAPQELQDQQTRAKETRLEEEVDTIIPEDSTIGEDVTSGRLRRKPRSNVPIYTTGMFIKPEPLAEDDDLAEWALIAPTPSRRKRKTSEDDEEFTPTKSAKAKAKKATSAQKTLAPRNSQQKASSGKKGTHATRAAPVRKPIGPLLSAIQADQRSGNMSLSLPPLPKDDEEQTAAGSKKTMLRIKTSKSPAQSQEKPIHDPDETEDEGQ
ncbi:hypothetical protein F5Y08DRAFT_348705 [Xylaria arbuscula]|nr:hypothetical protein F5Y08DRAFT_348705 [Xylaria arbuscula]